jgi:tryptophanase
VGAKRKGFFIDVRFDPGAPIAAPLARLLATASEMGVDVLSVSSTRAQTEDAFMHLLEADQSDGFSRAYSDLAPVHHGLDGAAESGSGRAQ